MLAIKTKYIGPTNHKPGRIKASVMERTKARVLTVSWDHALDVDANHEAAARALIRKLGWEDNKWAGGHCYDGMVFVSAVDRLWMCGTCKQPTCKGTPCWSVNAAGVSHA